MSKQWRLIWGSAALGLLIAVFFVIFVGILGMEDGDVYSAMLVLCPSLLAIPFSEVMKNKGGLYAVCLLIAFLNSGLYAVIGAAIAGQLWKSD
jgi:uncharacterized membrane protein YGL010W